MTYWIQFLLLTCGWACLFHNGSSTVMYQPDQVHLSLGTLVTEIVVTWNTVNATNSSIVEYGPTNQLELHAVGYSTPFVDGGPLKRKQFIHRVKLNGLKPGTTYFYHCGSNLGWSELFFFKTLQDGSDWVPQIVLFGDMGNKNPQSLPFLQKESQMGKYHAALHVGDFAYNMDTDNAEVGDEFMRQMEPVAAYLPYMTTPGNHEQMYNFSNYKARFSMPNTDDNMMYSFNIGSIHFISMCTEYFYFLNYGFKQVVIQYQWLEQDLIEATKPENRAQRPWIVTLGHRPMYCSNLDHDDCTKHETLVRVGIPFAHWFSTEDLFYKYGVDLSIWAHEHSYERMWPLYNRKVYNGSHGQPYNNPKAPVHITSGSAGCQEGTDEFVQDLPPWSAFRSSDYGYSRLTALNRTHLYMEQVSADQAGDVIDRFMLVKNSHEAYPVVSLDTPPDF